MMSSKLAKLLEDTHNILYNTTGLFYVFIK